MSRSYFSIIGIFLSWGLTSGCADGSEDEEGTLSVEIWGEDFIEIGIPATEFADGFSVTFEKFLINVGQIEVGAKEVSPALEALPMRVWDLTLKGPFPVASSPVPADRYDVTFYTVSKASSVSSSGNAADADVKMMIDDGLSVYVEGTATDGAVTKQFQWGFSTDTTYGPCSSSADVAGGDRATVQITIHGDHLFYDDAQSETPDLRFNDIVLADANGDDTVSKEELQAYAITPLPNYGVGNLNIDNFFDYISYMSTTLGHIDGEGHCQ